MSKVSEVTAEAAVDIEASPSEVWGSLTDPEAIKQYFLGADVETDWRVGSPITFRGEWQGKSYEDKGEILALAKRALLTQDRDPLGDAKPAVAALPLF